MYINIEDMTMREYDEMLQGRGNHGLDIKTIEAMTMLEYEEMLRRGNSPGKDRLLPRAKDSPGKVRLSIEEMSMNEYFEMMKGGDGSGLDQLSFTNEDVLTPMEFYAEEQLVESTLFHSQESCKLVNLISCDFTNEFIEFEQELIDEACFDALLLEDDDAIGLSTNQMEEIRRSLEAFNSDQDLKDFDILLDESITFRLEDDMKGSEVFSIEQPFSIIDISTKDAYNNLFENLKDVCVYYFRPRLATTLYRATRRWQAAWVKRKRMLVTSNDELFIDEYF